MRIRTQLVLAFLILSVGPLTGLVLYSYVSSQHSLRRAVEADAAQLTEEMNGRLSAVRSDVEGGLQRIGALPLGTLLGAAGQSPSAAGDADARQLLGAMGAAAPLVESVEFAPMQRAAAPAVPPAPRSPNPPRQASAAGATAPRRPAPPGMVAGLPGPPGAAPPAAALAGLPPGRSPHLVIPMRSFVMHFRHLGAPGPADQAMRAADVQRLVDQALQQADKTRRWTEATVHPPGRKAAERWGEAARAWREAAGGDLAAGGAAVGAAAAAAAGAGSGDDKDWLEVGDDADFGPPAVRSGRPPAGPAAAAPPQAPSSPPTAAAGAADGRAAVASGDLPSPDTAGSAAQAQVPEAVRRMVEEARREAEAYRVGTERTRRSERRGPPPPRRPPVPAPPAPVPGPLAAAGGNEAASAAAPSPVTVMRQGAERQPAATAVEADTGDQEVIVAKGLAAPVRQGDSVVGHVTAQVSCGPVLRAVLKAARRDAGEIPFAFSAAGHLYTIDDADRKRLERLPKAALRADSGAPASRRIVGDWVVVTSRDPVTGLNFGIARPIGGALREVGRAAARNFGAGVGLIGLALLGILPLSGGMTRNLRLVTDGADRIARGDLAARVPVRSASEFGQLAAAFNRMAEDLSENQRRLVDQELGERLLRSEFERKTAELEEARRFQLALLPKSLPEHPDLAVAVAMRTATEVGGDYYDFHLAQGGALTVAIGDATGHGAKAGTMVIAIKSLLSADFAAEGLSDFLAGAARAVRRMDLGRMAMALALARLTPGWLTVSSAGMPPVLVYRRRSGEVEEIVVPGLPLGSMASEYHERRVAVEAGDTILLASDGLPELVNADGDPLGYARVRELLAGCGGEPPAAVIAALSAAADSWAGGQQLKDDLTLVVVQLRS